MQEYTSQPLGWSSDTDTGMWRSLICHEGQQIARCGSFPVHGYTYIKNVPMYNFNQLIKQNMKQNLLEDSVEELHDLYI